MHDTNVTNAKNELKKINEISYAIELRLELAKTCTVNLTCIKQEPATQVKTRYMPKTNLTHHTNEFTKLRNIQYKL